MLNSSAVTIEPYRYSSWTGFSPFENMLLNPMKFEVQMNIPHERQGKSKIGKLSGRNKPNMKPNANPLFVNALKHKVSLLLTPDQPRMYPE